ncbi:MAG: hypothetical protein N4A74_20485 [Carboxylicivirga sp.]|nr:hypothetical protein [Carboxylicivirga sp.]
MKTIRIFKRDEIDDNKWDACVKKSVNGHVFAQTWYLDIISKNWDAVILNDYDAVLPLPIKPGVLFGQKIYTPYWSPYLGLINNVPVADQILTDFLNEISYYHVSLVMNHYNKLPAELFTQTDEKQIAVLDLIEPIDHVKDRMHASVISAVKGYQENKMSVVRSLDAGLYTEYVKRKDVLAKKKQLNQLLQILSFSIRFKSAAIYAAYDEYNEMIAGAFLLKFNNHLTLIHCASLLEDFGGVHAIIYHILKNNAGSDLTLSFPFDTDDLGCLFTSEFHLCKFYKKGLPRWISL